MAVAFDVVYPTNLPVDQTQVMGRRVAAWIIDLLITSALVALLFIPLHQTRTVPPSNASTNTPIGPCNVLQAKADVGYCFAINDTQAYVLDAKATTIVGLTLLGWAILMQVLIQGFIGATLGKLIMGIRVVRYDGSICGPLKAGIRYILLFVDSLPFCVPLVGIVTSFTTRGHRRIGDMAAGTLVVAKSAVGSPISVPGLTVGIATGYGPMPDPTYQPGMGHTSDPNGPRWDPIRDTYIQWDEPRAAWLQWNDQTKSWDPISTASSDEANNP